MRVIQTPNAVAASWLEFVDVLKSPTKTKIPDEYSEHNFSFFIWFWFQETDKN